MGKAAVKFMCGTPPDNCGGVLGKLSRALMDRGIKVHGSPQEAFNCHKRYLISKGYIQIDSRGFQPPEGGPIRSLTKKSRFGGRLIGGKEGQRQKPGKPRHGGICVSM